jgi:hypothetical protein
MGCEENNTNNISLDNIEVVTSDCYETPFYYNLITNTEDTTTWQISLQNISDTTAIGNYDMPSIILGSNILISIYNSISFDDIIAAPENVEWFSDTSLTSYGNEYEVLHYKFTCSNSEHTHPVEHKIMVMPNNYLIKELSTNNTYKLHFEDYNSGVALFKFSQLNAGN